ncbi:MAG: amidase [Chloroflexi bacterium]|nr:MAG: amidase [Chloroflexota bacterium]
MALATTAEGLHRGAGTMNPIVPGTATTAEAGVPSLPVVFWGRCSTAQLQDPTLSIPKQLTDVREKLLPGMFIAAYYWDIESGAKELEERGYGHAHELFEVPVPRDGGLQDLLREATRPDRPFVAVVCASIDRGAREWIPALQLERDLERHGVPLLAANEPMTFDRSNPSTVLLRRFNMALAEWYRLQLLAESRKGIRTHTMQGWSWGPVPYGYLAEKVPHPVPARRAEGKTKTRLVVDPERAPVVPLIFHWRVDLRLGYQAIADRLNADPVAYPPARSVNGHRSAGCWQVGTVRALLQNPKYTGYMVWGVRKGDRRRKDDSEWVWSPELSHPPLVTRELWRQASEVAHETERTRQGHGMNRCPGTRHTYVLRSHVRCSICGRRMVGKTRPGNVYYRCNLNHSDPRTAGRYPDHPKGILVREDLMHWAVETFFREHVFGPRRLELLSDQFDGASARAYEEHAARVSGLEARIAAAEKGKRRLVGELESLPDDEELAAAMRASIQERFGERDAERRALVAELETLRSQQPEAPENPALLEELPTLAIELRDLPEAVQRELFAAFGLVVRYDKRCKTAEVCVTVTSRLAAELQRAGQDTVVGTPLLHGIPILVKDNIDTHDRMHTTAGSLALLGSTPPQDSALAARLRAAGAVILGKTNLTEWANFRAANPSSGWSGRGGQCLNPYALDRNPCGSSSGSGAAVAANLCAAALGTETDGSILCPSGINMVVGIKPTLGLTSRAGVIPISHNQDTVGPMARTVADAAAVLGALVGVDPRDPATTGSAGRFFTDYTRFLDPNGLRGARIGVIRQVFAGFQDKVDVVYDAAIQAMRAAGAVIVDPADLPDVQEIAASGDENTVLLFDFKADLNAYLAARRDPSIHTLQDLIDFNNAHAAQEMPFFGQEVFLQSQAVDLNDPATIAAYQAAVANDKRLGGRDGIDAALSTFGLDALVAPTNGLAWKIDLLDGDRFLGGSSTPTSLAGYPAINVPAAFSFGLPVGITFMGTAFSEPALIKLASGFEAVTKARRPPKFLSPSLVI